ncbi:MAG: transporter substrate-binding domain-containing protein [Thalassotalea sp.]|nr:transporter substrate-binding domain-containing protein [Thalassotalea sp.]
MRLALAFLLLCIAVPISHGMETKKEVLVYSYHLKPPLVVDDKREIGLYFDIVTYLNKASDEYHFDLVYVPRKRIEVMMQEGTFNGILLGVNPVCFKGRDRTKYLLTDLVLSDRDELISLKTEPFEFNTPKSLNGKVFGGVRGFYYFGINEYINAGNALRIDTEREIDLFTLLARNRIDTALISQSTFDYMIVKNQWHGKFHVSEKPHDIYGRHILVPKDKASIFEHINPIVKQLHSDSSWQQTLTSYK